MTATLCSTQAGARLRQTGTAAALLLMLAGLPATAAAQSAEAMYTRALARERSATTQGAGATLKQLRTVVRAYEAVVHRFPRSGYSDNALWQAAQLSWLAFERFGESSDRAAAVRLFTRLRAEYPSSSLARRVPEMLRDIEAAGRSTPEPSAQTVSARPAEASPARAETPAAAGEQPAAATARSAPRGRLVTIRDVKRTEIPDGVRVTIEMDGESLYRAERLENPSRVFFDLKGTRAAAALQDRTLTFDGDLVREVRVGRHPQNTTRVVMAVDAVEEYSVFTLYDPFRLVVDFRRTGAPRSVAATSGFGAALGPIERAARLDTPAPRPEPPPPAPLSDATLAASGPEAAPRAPVIPAAREPVAPARRTAPAEPISPTPPAANGNGRFSIARQLGLGISRIVLDAGHGGHDPGARANGLNEADLVLDVTLRLRALLEAQPGFEVTLTRDADVFVPLEERTAIANRTNADLFLSIHANASRNASARGIETYFLNFASNPEAAAVAARENSGSGKTMHSLPDIVRAIALSNKIDESRDFADMVQKSMVRRLSAGNGAVRDLGVKQAPFVVLIGAGMPSVLAEISFVTNKQDAAQLKSGAYRQQIAESLLDAILRYQRSLKGSRAVASR